MGRRQWNVDLEQVINLGEMLGIDLKQPEAAITPTQALKKGMDKETVNSLSERKQGSIELVKKGDTVASRILSKK